MWEKGTGLGHCKGLVVWRTPALVVLMRMLFFILTLWVTILWQPAQPGKKIVVREAASLSTSEGQAPLFQSVSESSWQGGQRVSEMELSQPSGCLL